MKTNMAGGEEQGERALVPERRGWFELGSWFQWRPTSIMALAQAERAMLRHIWEKIESNFVTICNGTKRIRTVTLNQESGNIPLVMVHGMGSGVGLWSLNLDSVSQKRPVYAFDVLGFGRSSRPKFSKDPVICEMEFVESIEEWRKEMNLDKFVLLGHSLGGYLVSAYALRYPERIRHLILVDPWGFPEKPENKANRTPIPVWARFLASIFLQFNPLSGLRAAGPWGPSLVGRFRPDLVHKFSELHEGEEVVQYIYHCNAQDPSGEAAFKSMLESFGWAKHPMIRRIPDIPSSVPMTFVYGSRSWMDSGTGYEIKYLRNGSYVDVQIVKGAGHHVYADQRHAFNQVVNRVCESADRSVGLSHHDSPPRDSTPPPHKEQKADSQDDPHTAKPAPATETPSAL